MAALKKLVRRRFPKVRQLSTEALAEWLTDPDRTPPILLDTRSEKEFAVGHLPGARRVNWHRPAAEILAELPPGRTVVAYCVAGYRSSELAKKLMKAGFQDIYNL
jgi:rhodanese-related sulfurtransferase